MKPLGLFIKKDITLNEELYNLVEGKRVTLIGPAPYLQGLGRGEYFDAYDIVVRPNEIIPLRDIRCDYGSRTDIMFCNFGTPWMPGIKRKLDIDDHMEHFKNLKLVVSSGIKAKHSDTDYLSWPDDHVSDIIENFNEINKYDLPFYWIGVKDYKALYSKVGVEFNTGLGAILILLQYPIKELYMSGFSFFKGGDTYEDIFCKGHMDELDTNGKPMGFTGGHGPHANQVQFDYFKNFLRHSGDVRLNIDSYLKNLLGIEYENVADIV